MRQRLDRRLFSSLLALTLTATLAAAGELDHTVRELASAAGLGPEQYGVSIVDVETGLVLAEVSSDRAFIPASNQKLLSSGAALVVLGCDYAFQTDFVIDGDRLIVRGSGDPALGDAGVLERLDPPQTVENLLGEIVSAVTDGNTTNFSEIVLDDRVFDRERVHESWPVDQLNRWYCAEVDGITFHANVVRVFPTPATGGGARPPSISLQPDFGWLDLDVRAKTVTSGENTVWVARPRRSNDLTVFGNVRYPAVVDVATHEPSLLFGRLLADAIESSGVNITSSPRFRLAEEADPATGGRVAARVSTPVLDVARRCNVDSYNLYGEALMKRIGNAVTGEPGSWDNGAAVIRMTMRDLIGPDAAADTAIADGSGMSRDNRVAPATLTAWLAAMANHEDTGDCFIASLPTVGEGTLRRRFREQAPDLEIRAKSGTLNGVSCLSGYVTDPSSGRRLAFSVLCNDLGRGTASRNARRFHERIALLAETWIEEQEQAPAGFGG